ncbi:hypothetical protein [Micromonospora zamorensis]|uniref:hypothetical protein n=1 Tax=Micromonospora zamorensis TaxID=709883 RepID=UPI0037ADD3E7
MARSDRLRWVAAGSPFRLMTPARDLRDTLRRHGYTVYDIGNQSHLEHDPPEDHTPYSATGYPGKAKYGIGYAVDVMPPPSGARSKVDGQPLPSLQQLGAQLLADRNGGVGGISWLKYMNWEPQRDNGGTCYQESWRPLYVRRTSTDRGHIHMSGLTGFESSTTGAGYDPVSRIRGEDDMDKAERDALFEVRDNLRRWFGGMKDTATGAALSPTIWRIRDEQEFQPKVLAALSTLTGKDFTDEDAIIKGVLGGLGTKPAADVAQALVAAGQNPSDLAAELAKLAKTPS